MCVNFCVPKIAYQSQKQPVFTTDIYVSSHSVHPQPYYWGVEPPTKFAKGEGLDRTSIFRRGCWERDGDLFQGESCNFYIKHKLNKISKIFNNILGLSGKSGFYVGGNGEKGVAKNQNIERMS